MKRQRLIVIPAILLMTLSVQSENTANAGPYVAGQREQSVKLSKTQRLPASSRQTSIRQSASGPAIGATRSWQQTRPTTAGMLGSAHGRRLTPAQSRALINSPGFRKCGVDISCTTRIVSDSPASASSLGDMLAREQIRDAIGVGLSPFAQTPVRRVVRTPPPEELADRLAREAVRQHIGEFISGF